MLSDYLIMHRKKDIDTDKVYKLHSKKLIGSRMGMVANSQQTIWRGESYLCLWRDNTC